MDVFAAQEDESKTREAFGNGHSAFGEQEEMEHVNERRAIGCLSVRSRMGPASMTCSELPRASLSSLS